MEPRRVWLSALLLGLVACGWIGFVWLWEPSVLTLPVDDSFYYFATALHAARGAGFTFDGLHPTNGFHPLWMWMLVPPARLFGGSMDLFVRCTLTLQLLLVCGGTALLGRASPFGRANTMAAAALLLLNFYLCKVLVNGLESSVQYAALCATLAWWTRWQRSDRRPTARDGIALGALCALAFLARLSAGFFVATLLGLGLREGWAMARTRASMAWACVVFGSSAGTYLLCNKLGFGHWLPVSAAIKWEPEHLASRGFMALMILVAATPVVFRVARTALRPLAPLLGYIAAQAGYDLVSRGVLVPPELWYFVPHLICLVVAVSALVAQVRAGRGRAFAALFAALFFVFTVGTWRRRLQPESYSPYVAARRIGQWLSRETPPQSIIAGWDCGIVAGYANRHVINLDGLANSWSFKESYLDRGRVGAYLADAHVGWIAQWFSARVPLELAVAARLGSSASAWRVAHIEPYQFRRYDGARAEPYVYVILSRDGEGPLLREAGARSPTEATAR